MHPTLPSALTNVRHRNRFSIHSSIFIKFCFSSFQFYECLSFNGNGISHPCHFNKMDDLSNQKSRFFYYFINFFFFISFFFKFCFSQQSHQQEQIHLVQQVNLHQQQIPATRRRLQLRVVRGRLAHRGGVATPDGRFLPTP